MIVMNRQWVFVRNPDGAVTPDVFQWGEEARPSPDRGEVLVRNRMLSIDPANRAWMRGRTYREQIMPGDVMHGFTLSEVVESSVGEFQPGDIVETMGGWQDYAVVPASALTKRDPEDTLEQLIGVFGITGLTAYFGLFEVGRLQAGDTVLVSAAAGAVGTIAGQLCLIAGARVVGIAGGPEKCAWLTDDLGYSAAVDYKRGDLGRALREACPEGVDLYFDNVGGEILDAALRVMSQNGRIICSGAVSNYNVDGPPFVSPLLPGILASRRLRMEGFIVLDHFTRREKAEARMRQWISTGKLKPVVDMTVGLEAAPDALIRLLRGGNRGKAAVLIS